MMLALIRKYLLQGSTACTGAEGLTLVTLPALRGQSILAATPNLQQSSIFTVSNQAWHSRLCSIPQGSCTTTAIPELPHHNFLKCLVGGNSTVQVRHVYRRPEKIEKILSTGHEPPNTLTRKRVAKGLRFDMRLMPNDTQLRFGKYGIRAIEHKARNWRITLHDSHIEIFRRIAKRVLGRGAAMWMRVRGTVPVTRKPSDVRRGKGKGSIAFYASPVRPGQIIMEFDRVKKAEAFEAFRVINDHSPVKLEFCEFS